MLHTYFTCPVSADVQVEILALHFLGFVMCSRARELFMEQTAISREGATGALDAKNVGDAIGRNSAPGCGARSLARHMHIHCGKGAAREK